MSIIQGTSKSSAAGYSINQSIRFNDNDSAFLKDAAYSASPTSATDCTFSFWVKRCNLSSTQCLFFGGDASGSTWEIIRFESDNQFRVGQASSAYDLTTTQVFRDVAAWSNFVVAFDTDNSTAADRIKIYHNGSRITDFSLETNPSSGYVTNFNSGGGSEERLIGFQGPSSGGSNAADCYLAEINFIDGQALDPTSFGETDSDSGQFIPKKYSGSYGTNGYYLKGEDSSDLGNDSSGNNNDFTSSGLTAADQMSDAPTANHCTLNPLWVDGYTLSDGNLVTNQSGDAAAIGTMAFDPTDSQGFYFEAKVTTAASFPNVGIRTAASCPQVGAVSSLSGNSTGRFAYTGSNGQFNDEGSGSSYGSTWAGTADKVIGVFVKAGELFFSVDGTIQNSGTAAKTGLTGLMVPTVFYDAGSGTQAAWEMRFDASDWSTTPTGYKALSTANLSDPSIPDPTEYFQTTLYSGNTSTQSINQSGNSTFQPDWAWIKARGQAYDHALYDAVRGATKELKSNAADAQSTITNGLTAFESDGFALGNRLGVNQSGQNYVAWQWKANGSGSSNSDGSVTSTVSNEATANFSIVKYTGTGSGNSTVGHGLGTTPTFIICKHLGRAQNWRVFHTSEGVGETGFLNDTAAWAADPDRISAVSSTTFTAKSNMNESADYIAYCFADVEGYSKFGGFVGNSSADGPFVFTGFKPSWLVIKRASGGTGNWDIFDNQRDPLNAADAVLDADTNAAEATFSTIKIDFLSNGFKIRGTQTNINSSGHNYVFSAFAETPFKTATAR